MAQSRPPIRGVTFDFWRTLFYAQSRLPERRRARVETVIRFTGASPEAAKDALKHIAQEFLRIHITEQRTPDHNDTVPILEQHFECSFNNDERAALAEEIADAFLDHPPEPIDGALEAVQRTAKILPVGIISDTGISPGSRIEKLLDRHGFLKHLTSLTFSDEVGAAKPSASMFEHAASRLNVETKDLLHIGDLEPTDIKGARNVGAQSALFAGDNDRYVQGSQADFIFHSWADYVKALSGILN